MASLSVKDLDKMTVDELIRTAEEHEFEDPPKVKKPALKAWVRDKLQEKGALLETEPTSADGSIAQSTPIKIDSSPLKSNGAALTFEQQKELLEMDMQQRRLEALEREKERQLEYEKLKHENQKLEHAKAMAERSNNASNSGTGEMNLSQNVKLLPKFNERDPDIFFSLFENVAVECGWTDSERTLLLQSIFTGKAQEAFIALSETDRKKYTKVKEAVLRAFEWVPEAYRSRFRNWRKGEQQTHTELVRELSSFFNRWLAAENIKTFEQLSELMVLEQFKNIVPERVATYISEQKPKTAAGAATLADEFALIHKRRQNEYGQNYDDNRPTRYQRGMGGSPVFRRDQPARNRNSQNQCHNCFGFDHWKNECPKLLRDGKNNQNRPSAPKPVMCAAPVTPAVSHVVNPAVPSCHGVSTDGVSTLADVLPPADDSVEKQVEDRYGPFLTKGFVSLSKDSEKVAVRILRDTGASETFIKQSVLPFSCSSNTGKSVLIRGIGMTTFSVPLHRLVLHSDLVQGEVVVAVRPSLPVEGVDVILGNDLAGGRVWPSGPPPPLVTAVPLETNENDCADEFPEVFSACAVTRAKSRAQGDTLSDAIDVKTAIKSPTLPDCLHREELISAQSKDERLSELIASALPADHMKNAEVGYFMLDGILVRKWLQRDGELEVDIVQIVIPDSLKTLVLKTGHGEITGHFGVRKTYKRLLQHFYWHRIKKDVAAFIKTCHVCQITGKPNQCIKPAPLHPIPAVGRPFEHLIVDCVGPLPPSKSGSAYLLTVMCQSTRYPAAYPLRSITTRSIVKALSQFISIFGIPKVIQSDRGSNFTSNMFAQVLKELHVKHSLSSAYHPQSQGALERFHSTLKSLLRAYCVELNRDWEDGLPWLMLAAREVTQESTGFSPNDLVFGHKVRGPLSVLKDCVKETDPPVNLLEYVQGFRRKLFLSCELANKNLAKAQGKMKRLFDRGAAERVFSPGDQILALLPLQGAPFKARFSGPYTVVRKVTELDYLVATPDRKKSSQLCHVNMLKPYYTQSCKSEPADGKVSAVLAVDVVPRAPPQVAVGEDEGAPDDAVLMPRLKNSEMLKDLNALLIHVSSEQREELKSLILSFPSLFSDTPTCTDWIEHDIELIGETKPIRQRFYRVSPEKKNFMDAEVQYLLDTNLAKPSNSSWTSPCLLVGKPDGTFRFCTDYRKLNTVTKPDSFPLPRMEDCIDLVGSARFVTKIDLLKGYYQVPLTKRAQELSAFVTPSGLYSYNVMSFGLRNAPSTFQRLMNRVISGLDGCAVYLDDCIVTGDTWEQHVSRLRALFARLVEANLTVNLAKCEFAQATVIYLGKVVGQGQVRLVRAKVLAIDGFPPPTTKKALRRFLGMVGYYRGFCANFSSVVSPLTDLLKDKVIFNWSPSCQQAFEQVKMLLSTAPVLAAPKLDQPFQLQVDASNVGAGAVLLQADEQDVDRPVSYFSRKFNKHQLVYSTIEKEALALIWALQHFDVYVGGGSRPVVVYSDHNPLTFLHSLQSPNQRLMRWALFLQPYNLIIRHIRGVDNVIADALSRILEGA